MVVTPFWWLVIVVALSFIAWFYYAIRQEIKQVQKTMKIADELRSQGKHKEAMQVVKDTLLNWTTL